VEEEAAAGCALAGVHIGATFGQAESHELICFRGTSLGTDEYMIELNRHKLFLAFSSYRPTDNADLSPKVCILQTGSSLEAIADSSILARAASFG
jgi:hypothetical protein